MPSSTCCGVAANGAGSPWASIAATAMAHWSAERAVTATTAPAEASAWYERTLEEVACTP